MNKKEIKKLLLDLKYMFFMEDLKYFYTRLQTKQLSVENFLIACKNHDKPILEKIKGLKDMQKSISISNEPFKHIRKIKIQSAIVNEEMELFLPRQDYREDSIKTSTEILNAMLIKEPNLFQRLRYEKVDVVYNDIFGETNSVSDNM